MSTFDTKITLVNNTDSEFTLNNESSSGIGSDWPTILEKKQTYTFSQGWDFQIKFTAWYDKKGGGDDAISFYFYADGVEVFDCNVTSQPAGIFQGSTCESTSHTAVTFTINGKA